MFAHHFSFGPPTDTRFSFLVCSFTRCSLSGSAGISNLNSLRASLSSIPEDREVYLAELGTRKAEAEAEAEKARERMMQLCQRPALTRTIKAVISGDTVGMKTAIAKGVMMRYGLRGVLQRKGVLTEVSMEGLNSHVTSGMNAVKAEAKKKSWGEVAFDDSEFGNFSKIIILPTCDDHREGSSGGGESKFEPDDMSSLSSDSEGSGIQAAFRVALMARDPTICALCSSTGYLEAAHIYPKKGTRTTLFAATGLTNLYCTQNGILLCKPCHRFFDRGYWWIELEEGKYVAHISEALQSLERFTVYHLSTLNIDPKGKEPPDADLLKVQENFCAEQRTDRRRLRDSKPWGCPVCGKRWKTEKTLLKHIDEVLCGAPPDTPVLFSPVKGNAARSSSDQVRLQLSSDEEEEKEESETKFV